MDDGHWNGNRRSRREEVLTPSERFWSKDMCIDHICRNRACINPSHLRVVTLKQNMLIGIGFCALNAKRTVCPRGHALLGENLYLRRNGWRECRICKREQLRQWRNK